MILISGRQYEQARVRLLLERMDKEGFSHTKKKHKNKTNTQKTQTLLERLDKEGFSHLTFHHYQNINCKMCPGSCFWSVDHILVIAGC